MNTRYIFTCFLLILAVRSEAGSGNDAGGGGSGFAYAFTELGYRIHRELLMQPYDKSNLQARDVLPLDLLLTAVDGTKVIATNNKIYDRNRHEATAVYFTPDELREKYINEGVSEGDINKQISEMPYGLVVINIDRFNYELKNNFPLALATVFHEYMRVMGLPEDNYKTSARNYNQNFFARIAGQSSATSKNVYQRVQSNPQLIADRIAMIDAEKIRIKNEMREDINDLKAVIIERRPFVEAQREAYTRTMNAYAELVENLGIIPMPFPSYRGRVLRYAGKVGSEGINLAQKLSELEVINLKANFLKANYKRNEDFYKKIDLRRQGLFCESVGGC